MGPRLPAIACLGCLVSSVAAAQTSADLPDDYTVDIYQGAVLGSSRVTALGGAFAGVAEESVGLQFNPAAAAHRPYFSSDEFEWYVDWAFLAPGLGQSDDFDLDNSGIADRATALGYFVGGAMQLGPFGVGLFASGKLSERRPQDRLRLDSGDFGASVGLALLDHRLVVGVGVRSAYLQLRPDGTTDPNWAAAAIGVEAGALYRPHALPFRLGVTLSSPRHGVLVQACEADLCPADLRLPTNVTAPWQLRVGAAWFVSAEGVTFNPEPFYLDTSPAAAEARRRHAAGELDATYRGGPYGMLTLDVVAIGPSENTFAVDSVLSQTALPTGNEVSLSLHVGAELEVLRRRLRLRLGAYREPGRSELAEARIHATMGVMVRVFDIPLPWLGTKGLAFQSHLDLARNYTNVGGSLVSFWN